MANFFSKFFKPKWQSSSVDTRIEALSSLDASNKEEFEIIRTLLLTDESEQVRLAALDHISDPSVLIKLFREVKDDDKPATITRLSTLSEQLGLNLFDLIEDNVLLAEVIIESGTATNFMNSLARIQDDAALTLIAQQAQLSKVRQAATELIESEPALQSILDFARSKDKKVFQIAKAKLNAIKQHQKDLKAKQEEVSALVQSLNEHAKTDNTSLYGAKLDNLQQRWSALKAFADSTAQNDYLSALEQCESRLISIQAETTDLASTTDKRADDAEAQTQNGPDNTLTEEQQELKAALQTLEATLAQVRARPASPQETSAIDAIIKTQETRWIESTKTATVSDHDKRRYDSQMHALRQYLKSLQKLAQNQTTLTELLENNSASLKSLRAFQKKIDWPAEYALPEQLTQLASKIDARQEDSAAQAQEQLTLCEKLQHEIDALDGLLDDKQLKQAKTQIRTVRNLHAKLDKKHQGQFNQALKLRSNQLNELLDWQGFAASPEQTRLCEAMEQLAEKHLDPLDKSNQIKELQTQWKALGGSRDQSLWERFSSAADKAFEPCAAYFSEQEQLKKTNIEKRQTLLNELSAFIEQINWESVDWKALDTINRRARSEWRDAYPVDHKKSRALQERFNATLNTMDKHLDQERQRNLATKQEIVERAQALVHSEDLNAAMQGAKDLQSKWQTVGITEHKKDRALWKAFRAACDEIFARRDEERSKQKEASQQKSAAAKEALEQARITAETTYSTINDANDALKALRSGIKVLNDLPHKEREKQLDAYNQHIDSLKAQLKNLNYQGVLSYWQEAQRKAELLYQAHVDPSNDDSEQFLSKVALEKSLESNFQSAWKQTLSGKRALADETKIRELCVRSEITAGIESPTTDQELRMQLQVSRLSEGLSGGANLSREAQLNKLLSEWFAQTLMTSEQRSAYKARIDACIAQVFSVQHINPTQKSELETA